MLYEVITDGCPSCVGLADDALQAAGRRKSGGLAIVRLALEALAGPSRSGD